MITGKRWRRVWADLRWQYERRALTPFERAVMLDWHERNPDHQTEDAGCEWCKQGREDEAENNPPGGIDGVSWAAVNRQHGPGV